MDATLALARFVADSQFEAIDEGAQDESVRALVNWLGCALGGAFDPAVDAALDAFGVALGPAQCTLIGRGDRTDVFTGALVTGLAANLLDFDDTHLATFVHPSVPVAAALFALGEHRQSGGRDVAHAFVLGVEVACRVAAALGDDHYRRGWHVTATCGVLGAAAACAKLLGLDAERTAMALGIAATSAAGLVEMFGSAAKSLNMGFAARNGVQSALLAQAGFTAASQPLEGRRGLLAVLGEHSNPDAIVASLGTRWAIVQVAYKPYPCGVVLHPVIDACLALRARHNIKARDVTSVELRVPAQVLELTGRPDPHTALEAKLSLRHCVAVALADGAAGVRQFTEQRLRNTRIAELRSRVDAIAAPESVAHAIIVKVNLTSGQSVERHAGRLADGATRALSDAELSDKFRALASELLATDQAERLLALAWNMRALADIGSLARASVPEEEIAPSELPGSPLIPR